MKKPPSQTLLNYSILSLTVSPELCNINKCAPPLSGSGGGRDYWGSLRNLILGEFTKNQYIDRELSKKVRGAYTIFKFKRRLGKKEEVVFLRCG